jgi:flagellar basal-body rod protein FlgB
MATTTPMLQQLQGYLKVTTDRQQLIASNMANIDTPGYHTKEINFQAALQNAMSDGSQLTSSPASVDVQGLPERPDGNNVNIDRESMVMAQTQLQYQMGVQLIKSEFHRLLSAIKDGN